MFRTRFCLSCCVLALATTAAHAQLQLVSRQFEGTASASAIDKFCGGFPDTGSDSFLLNPPANTQAVDGLLAAASTEDCFLDVFDANVIGSLTASEISDRSFTIDCSATSFTTPPVAVFDPICNANASIRTTTNFNLTQPAGLRLSGSIKANNFSPDPDANYNNFAEIELVYVPSNTRFIIISGVGSSGIEVWDFSVSNGIAMPLGEYRLTTELNVGSGNAGALWNESNAYFELLVSAGFCNDLDFNNDEVFPDNQDIFDFIFVFSGGLCPNTTCDSIDFNNDGVFPDTQDLFDYIFVFSGGTCPSL